MKKIVILSLYPYGIVPGPRFRYEQYLEILQSKFKVRCYSFFEEKGYRAVHSKQELLYLIFSILRGYCITWINILKCLNADFVFIYRDVTPFGPPFAEWIIAKVLRKNIVYDFDDAVWITDLNPNERFKIWLRNPSKTDRIISWAYKVSCGNDYLCKHAKAFNDNVVLNPTTIDTSSLHNQIKSQNTKEVVIGWTGSHSTLKYLEPLIPIIAKLELELDFKFVVICNKDPKFKLQSYVFKPWNKKSEIEDLLLFNFGLMPLPDDEWARGKCGFKALQYMALGMPALVSPVGVNSMIVQNEVNGFICYSEDDWERYIKLLIGNHQLRTTLGLQARDTVLKNYSVESNESNFLSLFSDKKNDFTETSI